MKVELRKVSSSADSTEHERHVNFLKMMGAIFDGDLEEMCQVMLTHFVGMMYVTDISKEELKDLVCESIEMYYELEDSKEKNKTLN